MTEPESRIHLLDNGLSPRQKAKLRAHNATIADAEEIAVKVAEHYMQQIPGLVSQIIIQVTPGLVAEMLKAHGIVLQPPPPDQQQKSDIGDAQAAIGAVESPETRQSIEPSPIVERGE